MPQSSLSCREFLDFLADYLGDELSRLARRRFDAHLGVCPDCVAYLESYRETVALGREAFANEGNPPADAPPELVAAILDALSASR